MLVREVLVAAFLCFLVVTGKAETCHCPGSKGDHYKGGDGSPLTWGFETYVVKLGADDRPIWICYFKTVLNESKIEVRRINWEVADFYRRSIAPNNSSSSCPTIPGELTPATRVGRLYHGISDYYDTTVREPKEGWKEAQAPGSPSQELSPIESSFVFNYGSADMQQSAAIKIVSYAQNDGRNNLLSYILSNEGNTAVRLIVNLPSDGTFSQYVPFVSVPTLLEPNSQTKFFYITNGIVNLQHSTVVFYDQLGKEVLGLETAGFYGLAAGSRAIEVEKLRQFLRIDK